MKLHEAIKEALVMYDEDSEDVCVGRTANNENTWQPAYESDAKTTLRFIPPVISVDWFGPPAAELVKGNIGVDSGRWVDGPLLRGISGCARAWGMAR